MLARPIVNPLSTACADLLAPDFYLIHNSCEYVKMLFSEQDLLRAAADNFHQVNGSWWLIPVLTLPVSEWYFGVVKCHAWKNPDATAHNQGHSSTETLLGSYVPPMPPQLVLEGVSFACFALLALNKRCQHTFNRTTRRWTLNFNSTDMCAAALEVVWDPIEYWRGMGIEMVYSHEEPGKVTVSVLRPVQQRIAAPTTPTDERQ
jgi:hypothetical protein